MVDQPWEVVAVANKTIHPRTMGGEVGHGLMIPKPPLEEPNGVLLIVLALGM